VSASLLRYCWAISLSFFEDPDYDEVPTTTGQRKTQLSKQKENKPEISSYLVALKKGDKRLVKICYNKASMRHGKFSSSSGSGSTFQRVKSIHRGAAKLFAFAPAIQRYHSFGHAPDEHPTVI
jgi:hypothetical protein